MAELVAVVDLGSTAVRLVLAQIIPKARYRVLVQERAATRLGGGAPATLPSRAVAETLRAVHRFFRHYASARRGPRIVAVATSAVRDADNRERLLAPLRLREGINVQILSAREEAQLGVDAAVDSLPFTSGIVADLGGASLQLSRVRDRRLVSSASLPLGAVRTTRRFLRHDPPRPRELQALRRDIRQHLVNAVPPSTRGEVVVGLGGIVRTLARIHLRSERGDRKASPRARAEAIRGHGDPRAAGGHLPAKTQQDSRAKIRARRHRPGRRHRHRGGHGLRRIPDPRRLHARGPRWRPPARDVRPVSLTVNTDSFVNRELSWLEFNRRVLEEAQDPRVPLLERVKFLAIFGANLDEFFMVRVAALKRRVGARDQTPELDGLVPVEVLAAVATRAHELVEAQQRCFRESVSPLLAAEGIVILRPSELGEEQVPLPRRVLPSHATARSDPMAAEPGHLFPYLGNRSPCLGSPSARRRPPGSRSAHSPCFTSPSRSCRPSWPCPPPPGSTPLSSSRTSSAHACRPSTTAARSSRATSSASPGTPT